MHQTCLQTVAAICLSINYIKDVFLNFLSLRREIAVCKQVYKICDEDEGK